MGDRPGTSSRVRTSEDKVCRKDQCWFVGADYVLEKLPDVSGPGLVEAGRYSARPHHCCTCAGTPYRVGTARGAHHFLIHSPSLPLPFPLHLGARASRRRCRSTAAAPLLLRRCCCAPMCATAGQARVAHKRRWGHLCLAGRRCAAWCSPCRSRPWPALLLLLEEQEKDLGLE